MMGARVLAATPDTPAADGYILSKVAGLICDSDQISERPSTWYILPAFIRR